MLEYFLCDRYVKISDKFIDPEKANPNRAGFQNIVQIYHTLDTQTHIC